MNTTLLFSSVLSSLLSTYAHVPLYIHLSVLVSSPLTHIYLCLVHLFFSPLFSTYAHQTHLTSDNQQLEMSIWRQITMQCFHCNRTCSLNNDYSFTSADCFTQDTSFSWIVKYLSVKVSPLITSTFCYAARPHHQDSCYHVTCITLFHTLHTLPFQCFVKFSAYGTRG